MAIRKLLPLWAVLVLISLSACFDTGIRRGERAGPGAPGVEETPGVEEAPTGGDGTEAGDGTSLETVPGESPSVVIIRGTVVPP